jgi:hypothetical protein
MSIETILEKLKSILIPDAIKHNVITALSKGLGKLITAGINVPIAILEKKGNVIRAKGEAEVNQINAASEAAAKLFANNSDLANRALNHFAREIIESQVNRENVAIKVIENLKYTEFKNDTETNIDEDWLTQFWNLSSTKSNEEVQEILAKILTKEIIQPEVLALTHLCSFQC